MKLNLNIAPDLPSQIFAAQTTTNTLSVKDQPDAIAGFNLALHVNDDSKRVQQNRMLLLDALAAHGAKRLTWLNQTHSTICHTINDELWLNAPNGDGLITQSQGNALMMMTADCLPVVLINHTGTEVANLHAGWRGLAEGIIETTLQQMQSPAGIAWLGAAIGPSCFEVGAEVQAIFCQKYPALAFAFKASQLPDKYFADIYAIARYILNFHGVLDIRGADQCTMSDHENYYSYRRNAHTGRMATFVFIR